MFATLILDILLFRSQLTAKLLSNVLHDPIFQVVQQCLGGVFADYFVLEEQVCTFYHLSYGCLEVLPDLVFVELLALTDREQCF